MATDHSGGPTAGNVYLLDQQLSLGLVYTGLIPSRPRDTLGLAFNKGWVSDERNKARREAELAPQHSETVLELNYKLVLGRGITLQPDIQNCTSQSFRRIFDNLYMHSFKTSEGYIPVVVGVSISAADTSTGFPHPKHFMRHAYDGLTRSFDTGLITVQPFDPSYRSGV